jgi:uncharacterized membrane protein
VAKLETIVAVYGEDTVAESDWSALEAAAQRGDLTIADAALVENQSGDSVILKRQSHHGWGKGAVVGAVVGILFPPSILGAAVVGAGGGALIAGMTRALGRASVKDLGETLDSGRLAIIVVSPAASINAVTRTLAGARTTTTAPTASVEEVQQLLSA